MTSPDILSSNRIFQAKRIYGLYLVHIQSYKEPTFIPLSPDKTVIRGKNDVGKSVISKSLMIFGGVYDEEDYAGLVHYDHYKGQVSAYLDNRTILTAFIDVTVVDKGTEYERRKGRAIFTLSNWQSTAVLKRWDKYDIEIAEYIGWITLPEHKLCVNMMDGKRNILINTPETVNTALTDVVCRNLDLERRQLNIERAVKALERTIKQAKTQKAMLSDMLKDFKYPVIELTDLRDTVNAYLYQCNVGAHVFEMYRGVLQEQYNNQIITAYKAIKINLLMSLFITGLQNIQQWRTNKISVDNIKMKMTLSEITRIIGQYIGNLGSYKETYEKFGEVQLVRARSQTTFLLNNYIENIIQEHKINQSPLLQQRALVYQHKENVETNLTKLAILRVINDHLNCIITNSGLQAQQSALTVHKRCVITTGIVQCIVWNIEMVVSLEQVRSQVSRARAIRFMCELVTNYLVEASLRQQLRELAIERSKVPICPTCKQVLVGEGHNC